MLLVADKRRVSGISTITGPATAACSPLEIVAFVWLESSVVGMVMAAALLLLLLSLLFVVASVLLCEKKNQEQIPSITTTTTFHFTHWLVLPAFLALCGASTATGC